MTIRKGTAIWKGDLKKGHGTMKLESGAFEGNYSFSSRFEDGKGTNPEELIGAAHAGCFSMALSHGLAEAGYIPDEISTDAQVKLVKGEDGFKIIKIILNTEGKVASISKEDFLKHAEDAKAGCPVSQALKAVDIELNAKLL